MSFHDPTSDVARMNRNAARRPVKVHPWTWGVLKCAHEFSRKSDGVFDVTMARQLVKWDYLPRPNKRFCGDGSWRDIVLDDKYVVRFRRPLVVDLGGIAKGYAVDRSVEALKDNGITAGTECCSIRESRDRVPAVHPFERRDLAIGEAGVRTRVGRVGVLVIRATFGIPRVTAGLSLLDVENFAASMWGHCLTGAPADLRAN